MSKLAKYLNRHILGNIFDRPTIREAYSTDRSVLQIMPRLVALPENTHDICKLVRFSNQLAAKGFDLPITVRGSGLDKTGAAIGEGLILSLERLNQLEEIDHRGRLVRVQPGLKLGELNTALSVHGLCLPVEYNPRATIGGLIANCPTDDAFAHFGGIFHYVERVEMVVASGEVVQLSPLSLRALNEKKSLTSFEGALYRDIDSLLDRYAEVVINRNMRPFDTAGYANITRVRQTHNFNLLPLIFASQGTLGVVTDIILRVELLPSYSRRLAVVFPELDGALHFLNFVRDLDPITLKIFDMRIIQSAAVFGNQPDLLADHLDSGWLVLVNFGDRKARTIKKLQQCIAALPIGTFAVEETPDNTFAFQEFQTALTSFLNDSAGGERIPVLDDVYIPSYHLADFIAELQTLEATFACDLPLYGSFSSSNYFVRPTTDCTSLAGRQQIVRFLRQYSNLVSRHEGSITGGSPEGRLKLQFSEPSVALRDLLPAEQELYLAIKNTFDPHGIFNPHVKLGAEPQNILRYLRTGEQMGIID